MQTTEEVIDSIVAAMVGPVPTARESYIAREALYSLVRLAKAELILEMRKDVARAVGAPSTRAIRHRSKLATKKFLSTSQSKKPD